MPNSVTTIGERAFEGCSSISTINMSEKVDDIGLGAFFGCDMLNGIDISNGIKIIKDETFYNCSSLSNVKIPPSVTEIGCSAYYNCSDLRYIEIPNSAFRIEKDSYYGCKNITIRYPENSYAETFARENNIPVDLIHIHKYESTITKEPTCAEKGIRTYTCSCGDTYTEENSHNWKAKKSNGKTE